MATIRSFATPHKGLRNVISRFSLELSRTDFSNATALQYLKTLGNEMFILLNDHVHTENEHTLRHLEQRVPGSSQHDKQDHERLDRIQDDLQLRLQQMSGDETSEEIHSFYLDFTLFQSQYYEHTYEEERVTELLLQKHFTDDELLQHRQAIMTRLEPGILLLWLKYIIPAQRLDESLGMFSGLKVNAPESFFSDVMKVLKSEMEHEKYNELREKLMS